MGVSIQLKLFLLGVGLAADASLLNVDIFYPESGLDVKEIDNQKGNIFSLGLSSLPYNENIVRQYDSLGQFYYPWFGNYTTFVNNNTHRQGPSHWRLSISIDDEFKGNLLLLLSMNFYGQTIAVCDAHYTLGTCQPRHSPWLARSSSVGASVAMHPAFSTTGAGRTYTAFADFFSVTLDNHRDISVYVPWSLVENPTARSVTVMVLLDGDLSTTSLFAQQGGIDAAVLSGGLPEVVVIGVPPALNGSACRDPEASQCSQRYYELTPTPCDPLVSVCQEQQQTGGADLLLQFIWDDVVPAVLQQLGQQRGEVGIAGYSLGGLAACHAASSRPELFQRALCQSPSVWWNSGQLADMIATNFAASGAPPLAVVMAVGTQESPTIMQANYDWQAWSVHLAAVAAAWQSIGLGRQQAAPGLAASSSDFVYYTTEGGVHNLVSWADTVSYGLSLLYATQFPAPYLQSSARTTWLSPPAAPLDDAANPATQSGLLVITLAALGSCVLLLPANLYFIFSRLLPNKEPLSADCKHALLGS